MDENTVVFIFGYGTGLFSVIFILLIKYYYARWMNSTSNQNQNPLQNSHQNSPEQIDALIIHIIPPNKSLVNETCLVCLEEYTNKQAVVECTTCHRVLGHASCLENWFHQKLSCPNCRQIFIIPT